MTWRDDLDATTLREIFDRDIAPSLTAGSTVSLHPSLVLVGAQPGAGKSRAIADVRGDHPGAVPVIGDDFRAFHPDYRDLMRTDPLAMPHVTAQASGAWIGMTAEHLRDERRSVILETTMRQAAVVDQTARAFRDAGYSIETRVLAVPGAVSALGTVSRYLGTSGGEENRWTPSAAHEAAYEAMPATVEQLVASGIIDRVTVLTRAQEILYDRDVDRGTAAQIAAEARHTIEAGRRTSAMTVADAQAWRVEHEIARARIETLPHVATDLRETMRRLAAAAPEISAVADGTGARRSLDAAWFGVDVQKEAARRPRSADSAAERGRQEAEATRIARDVDNARNRGRDTGRSR